MHYLSIVDDCFVDAPGGMARVAWDVAVEMRALGHEVTVLCAKRADAAPDESLHDGIRVIRYERPRLPGWHPLRGERSVEAAAARARAFFSGKRCDIAHMHSIFTGLGAIRALGTGPRYIYTMHSPVVLEQRINWASQGLTGKLKLAFGLGRLRRMERSVLDVCAGIQTLSQYTRAQIQAFHGMADRVTVVPHWRRSSDERTMSQADARAKLGWSGDEKVFFTIRRHGPRYGLDLAIRAAAPLLEKRNARLVMAGDGPLRPQFEALARELGAADRISFPGRLSDEDLRLAYQAADLFLLPTLALECFGLITLEAFSFGCPVLSSDACAIPETMRPILPDFIVPAGDVAAMREKMDAFLCETLKPPSPEKLTQYVNDHFGREVVLPRMIRLLTGGN